MPHYLVVANQTLGSEHLEEHVRGCVRAGPCSFHIVVPATHPKGIWTEGMVRASARVRLDAALERFHELGAEADGEVGDPSPILAVKDALLVGNYDGVIISTLPAGASRWLKQDLPHRIQKMCTIPVVHIAEDLQRV